jgi:hypothetical protein
LKTAEKLAKEHGVDEKTVRRAGQFQAAAEKLGIEKHIAAGKVKATEAEDDVGARSGWTLTAPRIVISSPRPGGARSGSPPRADLPTTSEVVDKLSTAFRTLSQWPRPQKPANRVIQGLLGPRVERKGRGVVRRTHQKGGQYPRPSWRVRLGGFQIPGISIERTDRAIGSHPRHHNGPKSQHVAAVGGYRKPTSPEPRQERRCPGQS